ncbi:MAG: hypothetical protein ACJAT6_001565, partial [Akkermansiaceae bacterium]
GGAPRDKERDSREEKIYGKSHGVTTSEFDF